MEAADLQDIASLLHPNPVLTRFEHNGRLR
jgi:hypothetical protein